MPMFDLKCHACDKIYDMFVKSGEVRVCPTCEGPLEKVFVPGHANSVIGDEIDIYIRHGLCHKDGSPQRFTSKAEIAREAKRRGLTNVVEHVPHQGSDRNKHTVRWT